MAMSFPRSVRRLAALRLVRSRPSNRMEPATRDTLAGSSPMMANAETVLPDPLSPTRPSVSPRRTVKSASSITGSHSWRVRNSMRRPRTSSSAASGLGTGMSTWGPVAGASRARGLRRRPRSPATRLFPVGRSRPSESRSPSATRLKAKTVNMMAIPGKMTAQGAELMNWNPSWSIPPQLGVGGCSPIPRKLKPASMSRAKPRARASWMMIGEATFGTTWRPRSLLEVAPRLRADSM